jgi:hypothetical protein
MQKVKAIILLLFLLATINFASAEIYRSEGNIYMRMEPNTTISSSNYSTYSYQAHPQYNIYFKNNSNTADAVRFEKEGYFFTYDVSGSQLHWISRPGQPAATDTLGGGVPSNSLDTQIVVNGSRAVYPGAFSNTNLTYEVKGGMLKENFVLTSLPSIKDYDYLEYSGHIVFNRTLQICTETQCYTPSGTQDDFSTNGRIYFKDLQNKTIFFLDAPIITDALGRTSQGYYRVRGSDAQMFYYLRINSTFVGRAFNESAFPLYIDPTIVTIGSDNVTMAISPEYSNCQYLYCHSQVIIQNLDVDNATFNSKDINIAIQGGTPFEAIALFNGEAHDTIEDVNITLSTNQSITYDVYSTMISEGTFKYNLTFTYLGTPYLIDPYFITTGSGFNGTFTNTRLNNLGFVEFNYDYKAAAIASIVGVVQSGNLTSLQTQDANVLVHTEVNGNPGLDFRVNFTSVTNFSNIVGYVWYDGTVGHDMEFYLYNYNTSAWDRYKQFDYVTGYEYFDVSVINASNYVNNSVVQGRFLHIGSSNTNHRLYIDYIALVKPNITGSYASLVFDAGSSTSWNSMGWNFQNQTINMSVRSCNDNACVGESFGLLGSLPAYYSLGQPNNRYFQYNTSWASNSDSSVNKLEKVIVAYGTDNITCNQLMPSNRVWNIYGALICRNEVLNLSAGITITATGNLSLYNTTTNFRPSVNGGQILDVYGTLLANGGTVFNRTTAFAYYIKVEPGAKVDFIGSTITNGGYQTGTRTLADGVAYADGLAALEIFANDINLSNVTLINNWQGISATGAARLNVINAVITGNTVDGLWLENSPYFVIHHSTFTNNGYNIEPYIGSNYGDLHDLNIVGGSEGIDIWSNNNTFNGLSIQNATYVGMWFFNSSGNNLSNLYIYHMSGSAASDLTGIQLDGSSYNTGNNITIDRCEDYSLWFSSQTTGLGSNNNRFTNLIITNVVKNYGLVFSNSNNNTVSGLYVANAPYCIYFGEGNTAVYDNIVIGATMINCTNPSITFNSGARNIVQGFTINDAAAGGTYSVNAIQTTNNTLYDGTITTAAAAGGSIQTANTAVLTICNVTYNKALKYNVNSLFYQKWRVFVIATDYFGNPISTTINNLTVRNAQGETTTFAYNSSGVCLKDIAAISNAIVNYSPSNITVAASSGLKYSFDGSLLSLFNKTSVTISTNLWLTVAPNSSCYGPTGIGNWTAALVHNCIANVPFDIRILNLTNSTGDGSFGFNSSMNVTNISAWDNKSIVWAYPGMRVVMGNFT